MNKIWIWCKIVGGVIIAIGVLIIFYSLIGGKNKQKAEIDKKIKDIEAIDRKTEADKQELGRLQEQANQIQKNIEDANKRAAEALVKLGKKKEEPGDAGKAADNLNSVWK
jgi:uncharacterized protein YoxC